MLIGMVMRSKSVGVSCGVQLSVPTQDMSKRTPLQKVDNSHRTFVIRCGVVNQQSPPQQKIARKKKPGPAAVKCHVGRVVSRRRNDAAGPVTLLQIGNFLRPISETV